MLFLGILLSPITALTDWAATILEPQLFKEAPLLSTKIGHFLVLIFKKVVNFYGPFCSWSHYQCTLILVVLTLHHPLLLFQVLNQYSWNVRKRKTKTQTSKSVFVVVEEHMDSPWRSKKHLNLVTEYFKNLIVKHEVSEYVDGSEVKELVASSYTVSQACEASIVKNDVQLLSADKQYICLYCDKKFTRNSYLTCHLRLHTGESPFECHVCDQKFYQKGNLTRHIRTHTGEKPYTCDVCGRSFAQSSTLNRHKYTHGSVKPFPCSYCDKRFTKSSDLKIHERTHTKEKPFQCDECEKGFGQKSALTRHMRVHTGEKPYSCEVCGKAFNSSSNRNKHRKSCTSTITNSNNDTKWGWYDAFVYMLWL